MDVNARLEEVFRRLAAAPACGSADDSLELLAMTLIEVEDELSGLPYDPTTPLNDGRMYPPQEDNRIQLEGRADLRGYRTRGHRIYVSESGAILITRRDRTWVFEKADRFGTKLKL
jgi:hypothetical protein